MVRAVSYTPPKKQFLVSRQSGVRLDVPGACSWGKKPRFGEDSIQSRHSPWGDNYYAKNALYKTEMEIGKRCTMGVGGRCTYVKGTPEVGPATYSPVTSVAKIRSPLDGKQYCNIRMKSRHEVVIGAPAPSEQLAKPGPGTYNVREDFYKYIEYPPRSGKMIFKGSGCKLGMMLPEVDMVGEPTIYDVSPGLLKKMPLDKNGKPFIKSTFGMADRFESEGKHSSQSPDGELYYSHVIQDEDYTKVAKACSLGSGERTNWGKESNHTASPASYEPNYSAAKLSSPMDYNGMALRNLSPITQFAMQNQRKKMGSRGQSEPPQEKKSLLHRL